MSGRTTLYDPKLSDTGSNQFANVLGIPMDHSEFDLGMRITKRGCPYRVVDLRHCVGHGHSQVSCEVVSACLLNIVSKISARCQQCRYRLEYHLATLGGLDPIWGALENGDSKHLLSARDPS